LFTQNEVSNLDNVIRSLNNLYISKYINENYKLELNEDGEVIIENNQTKDIGHFVGTVPKEITPKACFELIFDKEILNHIIERTNIRREKRLKERMTKKGKRGSKPKSNEYNRSR